MQCAGEEGLAAMTQAVRASCADEDETASVDTAPDETPPPEACGCGMDLDTGEDVCMSDSEEYTCDVCQVRCGARVPCSVPCCGGAELSGISLRRAHGPVCSR